MSSVNMFSLKNVHTADFINFIVLKLFTWCRSIGQIHILFNFNLGWMNKYFISIAMQCRCRISLVPYFSKIYLVHTWDLQNCDQWIYFLKWYSVNILTINLFTVIKYHKSKIFVKISYQFILYGRFIFHGNKCQAQKFEVISFRCDPK